MEFSSFIGKSCTVLSKQNVRYSGTLLHIDPAAQKIQVTNVRSYGTENRPAPVFIPPLDQLFGLIEFHVNDLQDLKFDEPVKPAVPPQTASQPPVPPVPDLASQQQQSLSSQPQPPLQPSALQPPAPQSFSAEKAKPAGWENYNAAVAGAPQPPINKAPTPKQANTDSLQRAMGAMKINQGPIIRSNGNSPAPGGHGAPGAYGGHGAYGGRGGPRRGRGGRGFGGYHQTPHHDIKVPTSDFDFEASNKRFDKDSAAQHVQLLHGPSNAANGTSSTPGDTTSPLIPVNGTGANPKEEGEISETNAPKENEDSAKTEKAYNPSKSFFDNISSDARKVLPQRSTGGAQEDGDATIKGPGEGRGRGRGGGRGRARRDEERERNVETFGEPGGIGMLGPGAYVGGYGGYRGKRRRGRGGHRGGAGGVPRVTVNDG